MKKIKLVGYASGNGAQNKGCGDAPEHLKCSSLLAPLIKKYQVEWGNILSPQDPDIEMSHLPTITWLSQHLATEVKGIALAKQFFITVGGDHSSGIGTWSGAAEAYRDQGDIGLIWFDAHLDAHTYETTPTGNIHGMPVACLLGYGHHDLTSIMSSTPKIKPQNLVFIGARSYEDGEHSLLKKLGVKIYYMDEVKQQGLETIFKEAIKIVKTHTIAYGVSLDIDGIDPREAPGVGTPAEDGVAAQDLIDTIKLLRNDNAFIGSEIVEFNPNLDQQQKTEKITIDLLEQLFITQTSQNESQND